jgi:hypothetical protein
MLGLDDIERINGLPTRSGKMLLRTALTRLARHYGLLPPEHGEAEIARRIAGWMAEDGAVTLNVWRDAVPKTRSSPSPRTSRGEGRDEGRRCTQTSAYAAAPHPGPLPARGERG